MSDKERISPYNINTISSTEEMRIKISIRELLIDPTPNSSNLHPKNYMTDSKEN